MPFPAPHYPKDHPVRNLAFQEELDVRVAQFVDQAVSAGWSAPEVFTALEKVILNQRLAYEEDPDPADTPIETDPQPHYDGRIGTPTG
jgi:hypothetical protein